MGMQLEDHSSQEKHGDVCRGTEGAFRCPPLCRQSAAKPFCLDAKSGNSCRAKAALARWMKDAVPNEHTPGVMHTFFEPAWETKEKEASAQTLQAWEQFWRAAGWRTRVLGLAEVKKSPFYARVEDYIRHIPRPNYDAEYERFCYLRYVAMIEVGGGWMSDIDTLPMFLSPELGLPNRGRFTVYNGFVPSLVSGSKDEWVRILWTILNVGAMMNTSGVDRVSDMLALKELRLQLPWAFDSHNFVHVADAANWTDVTCAQLRKLGFAMHFSHQVFINWGIPIAERAPVMTRIMKRWQACQEPLYAQAIRRVQSGLTATRKALVLRVCSGTLGAGRPRLGGQQPAIVITPNDTDCALTTKFGRGRTEGSGTLQPHVLMTEPIASRSHFSVIYNEEKEKFQVMDTGSKWGTFKKVTKSGQPVSCGDWIRVGNAELIVRFCGGGCNSHRRHAHHRLHALGVAAVCGGGFRNRVNFEAPLRAPSFRVEEQVDSDDDTHQVSDKVVDILAKTRLNGAVQKNWSSSFERLCREVNPSGEGALRPGGFQARPSGVSLEATPLEIDFISGPRIGERMMLTNRLCTIGRGENCTVQLSDASLANVSRVHCSFRSCGGRWWLCDEGSTNGTWRRLSCALEPSEPCDINSGETLLAGVQELQVEEAELKRWWIPSPGTSVLSELCKSDR
ncbi:unnamed protein product [Effrenium voratum]|uniref:FHA domain-containing protein n=1 Tax=Effrenium voratum TaxID=2562239 RepID=A0AA36JRP3_9DINO|nr:unnamed protein product [Effrenium voratum]